MKKERKERKKGVQNRVQKGVRMGGPEGVQMGVQRGSTFCTDLPGNTVDIDGD